MSNQHDPLNVALSWSGQPGIEVLLYGLRPPEVGPLRPPDLAGWPTGTGVERFTLEDDPWPVSIDLFEIHAPSLPEERERALFDTLLNLTHQGATLGWYMFEGAFDGIAPLFTPWQIEQTYGICIPWRALALALTPAQRQSTLWANLATEAREFVLNRFPEVVKLERSAPIYDTQPPQRDLLALRERSA
jgi:hypothetical protein